MWRKDKAAYKTWLIDKIGDKQATARSHGFRFRGQYEEELKKDLDSRRRGDHRRHPGRERAAQDGVRETRMAVDDQGRSRGIRREGAAHLGQRSGRRGADPRRHRRRHRLPDPPVRHRHPGHRQEDRQRPAGGRVHRGRGRAQPVRDRQARLHGRAPACSAAPPAWAGPTRWSAWWSRRRCGCRWSAWSATARSTIPAPSASSTTTRCSCATWAGCCAGSTPRRRRSTPRSSPIAWRRTVASSCRWPSRPTAPSSRTRRRSRSCRRRRRSTGSCRATTAATCSCTPTTRSRWPRRPTRTGSSRSAARTTRR